MSSPYQIAFSESKRGESWVCQWPFESLPAKGDSIVRNDSTYTVVSTTYEISGAAVIPIIEVKK